MTSAWQRPVPLWVGAPALAALTGTLQHPGVPSMPLHDPVWSLWLAGCLGSVAVTYRYIWACGTYTLDRPRDVPAALAMGIPGATAKVLSSRRFGAWCTAFPSAR